MYVRQLAALPTCKRPYFKWRQDVHTSPIVFVRIMGKFQFGAVIKKEWDMSQKWTMTQQQLCKM